MLTHGKLDVSYFFGGAENCVDLLHISVAEIAEENNLPRVLEKYVCLFTDTLLMQAIATANKQLLSVGM